jgi:hypothetical protein
MESSIVNFTSRDQNFRSHKNLTTYIFVISTLQTVLGAVIYSPSKVRQFDADFVQNNDCDGSQLNFYLSAAVTFTHKRYDVSLELCMRKHNP